MAVCRLMVMDFMFQTGPTDEVTGEERYDIGNLESGIAYADGLRQLGHITEPFYRFNLAAFSRWAATRISEKLAPTLLKEESKT